MEGMQNIGNGSYTFGEMIMFDQTLTSSESNVVLGYLYAKFGLTG